MQGEKIINFNSNYLHLNTPTPRLQDENIPTYCYFNIQLLTGFEDNSSFIRPENGSVTRSCRLRATDRFEGKTKLPLSEEPVYNCFVIHRHCDVNITWHIEPMKIRPSVNSSTASNRSMNCWPLNRTVMQLIEILLLIVKMLCIYCIAFI